MFKLHTKLKNDLIPLGELSISLVFLLPDSDNPWLVIVPKVENIKEWHHLGLKAQYQLLDDINKLSAIMERHFNPDKINIGSLGNMVPQLHIHIIARFKGDKAWPGALWGSDPGQDQEKLKSWESLFKKELS